MLTFTIEVHIEILKHLPPHPILIAAQSCKQICCAAKHDEIWRHHIAQEWIEVGILPDLTFDHRPMGALINPTTPASLNGASHKRYTGRELALISRSVWSETKYFSEEREFLSAAEEHLDADQHLACDLCVCLADAAGQGVGLRVVSLSPASRAPAPSLPSPAARH
jgi:hypothetical protein